MYTLYVLKLEHGKFYVGITTQTPEARFLEHKRGQRAAYWTMKYKPVKILDTQPLPGFSKQQAEARENQVTRVLMQKHGLNNVRGGDLRDVTEYTKRFGWIFDTEHWEMFASLICIEILMGLFLIIEIKKHFF